MYGDMAAKMKPIVIYYNNGGISQVLETTTALLTLLCLGSIYLGTDCSVPFTHKIIKVTYSRTHIGLRRNAAAHEGKRSIVYKTRQK